MLYWKLHNFEYCGNFKCINMRPISHCLYLLMTVLMDHHLRFAEGKLITGDVKACGLDGICNCQTDSMTVNCSARQLTFLPIDIPCNTSALYLTANLITMVPKTWMLQFENLTILDISQNRISTPFDLPSNLFFLYISSNNLTESFRLPPKLLELDASENSLTNIEEFFRGGCSELLTVNLESESFVEIPDGLFEDCSKLRILKLRHNRLKRLGNGTFKGLTSLSELTLSYKSAQPVEVGLFTDPCRRLHSLLMSSFPSVPLPPGLFKDCSKLSELYIFQTNLSQVLDGTFIGCREVAVLSFAGNHFISSLPEGLLDDFRFIIHLDLSRLNLTKIPENLFRKVDGVSWLGLGYNRLKEMPDNLFSNTRHDTTHILLCYNELYYLSRAFFRNLPNLKEIYLSNNNLQQLEDRLFLGTQLQVIYLVQNNITKIQGRPFITGNESTVRLLHIANNPLGYVSNEAISDLVINATMTMTCVNTSLPSKGHDINMQCVASNVPIVIEHLIEKFNSIIWSFGGGGGYICKGGTCKSCNVGTYGNKITNGCIKCPAGGFYQDKVGMVSEEFGGIACQRCNNGTFVKHKAGTSALSCNVCPEGTDKTKHAGFRACFCLVNYYRTKRFGKCLPCPNKGMNCSRDYISIKPGYFWQWEANDSYAFKSFIKNIKTKNDSYNRTWSVYNGSIPKAHKCRIEVNCVNDDQNLEGKCQEGYQGWLCTVCQKGYYKLFGYCHKCHPEFVIGVLLLFIVLLMFLWLGIIHPLSTKSQATHKRGSGGDLVISRVKIMFGFYQVVDSYWHSMGEFIWLSSIQIAISRIIEVMSFTLSSVFVSPSCYISWFKWDPYTQLWILYITLLTFALILVLVYVISQLTSKMWPNKVGSFGVKTTCLKLFTFIMFASYAEACDVVFQLYNCDEFSLYEYNETAKIHLLHSHYNISCDTDLYLRYRRVFAIPGWIFICMFPLIMWAFLYKYSRNRFDDTELAERQYPEWLSFMCDNYKSQCWYWEVIELGRKVLLTFLPLAFGWEGVFITIGLFASGLFLALHAFVRPMKDSWDNVLQFLSLLFLNFNMIVAAGHSSDNAQPAMDIIVSLMNVSIFCTLTVEAIWQLFCLMKTHCRKIYVSHESTPLLPERPQNDTSSSINFS